MTGKKALVVWGGMELHTPERGAHVVRALLEEEAYNAAKFYDSRTRTKRSAVSAYQRFLDEYPTSDRAPEVRRRLFELQEEGK